MQSIKAWGLILAVATGVSAPVMAQDACTPTIPAGGALGVSRVVEIDTSSGPLFGAPYKEPSFLADGEVVLTFDDGPLRAYTMPVLDALAAHCTKATFFLVGRMAVADPEMVKEYARRGHTVGTHTWSHANLQALTPLKARAEIELGFSGRAAGAWASRSRPSSGFRSCRDPKSMIIHLQERQIAHLLDRRGQQGLSDPRPRRDAPQGDGRPVPDAERHRPLPRHPGLDGAGAAGPAGRAEGQGLSASSTSSRRRTPRRLPSSTARPRPPSTSGGPSLPTSRSPSAP